MAIQVLRAFVFLGTLGLVVSFRMKRQNGASAQVLARAQALARAELKGMLTAEETFKEHVPVDTELMKICAPEILEETCALLGDGPVFDAIQQGISASQETMTLLWEALGLKQQDTCEAVCPAVAEYLGKLAGRLPPASDVGCYTDAAGVRCDLDLSEQTLHDVAHIDGDLPNFHDMSERHAIVANASHNLGEESLELDYNSDEAVAQVANLFRIYPAPTYAFSEGGEWQASLVEGSTSGWQSDVQRRNQQGQAYVATAIRKFKAKQTKTHIKKWFGTNAFTSSSSRSKVQKVLNSVSKVLRNVGYIYPGSKCKSGTYAYVYPSGSRSKDSKGRYAVNLCKTYMKSSKSLQIETITHEASHHATAYTDDVDFRGGTAYGRSTCQSLAKSSSSKALKNADNYCYYIQDITDRR